MGSISTYYTQCTPPPPLSLFLSLYIYFSISISISLRRLYQKASDSGLSWWGWGRGRGSYIKIATQILDRASSRTWIWHDKSVSNIFDKSQFRAFKHQLLFNKILFHNMKSYILTAKLHYRWLTKWLHPLLHTDAWTYMYDFVFICFS